MKSLSIVGLVCLSSWLFVSESAFGLVVASTLPASRSVQTGSLAGVFATMINAGSATATNCRVELASFVDADFYYQITDPATNAAIGAPNTPGDIEAGQAQSFILGLTANSEVSPTDVSFSFICDNDGPAPVYPGLNTLYFSASDDPVPDIIALAATFNGDGIVNLQPDNQFGFFAVATINLGSTATISVSTIATGVSVSNALVCQTDPTTALCITDLLPTIETVIAGGSTPTFSIFVSSENEVAFDPAGNRISVTFSDEVAVRGSTSVAIRGGGSSSSPALVAFTTNISESIVQGKCVTCHKSGGVSGTTSLVFTPSGSDSDHLTNNFGVFQSYLNSETDGATQILNKAAGMGHGGGLQLSSSSSEYADLADFLELLTSE